MMICLYDKNTIDFNHNGLVVLSDCISCITIEELNKGYSLELEYPQDKRGKYLNIKGLNIIKADGQLFRVPIQSNIQANGITVKITANHIFYDLANDYIEDLRAENKSVHDALQIALSVNPKFNIGLCDDLGIGTAYFVSESPTQSIYNKILSRWGGELYRDNYSVAIKSRLGRDTGILISYGKNIQGFEQKLDWSGLATRIKLIGKDGLTIDLVNQGSKYIISPRVNDYPFVITKEVKFDNITDATELKNAGLALWGIIDLPTINYTIKFADLAKTAEYAKFKDLLKLKIGDSVIIRHRIFGCDLTARVIKIKKNILTDTIEELELGQFKDNISNKFSSMDKKIGYNETNIADTKADLKLTKTTVFQNNEQISLQAQSISALDGRVNSAELKITAGAIVAVVRSSTEYTNDLGQKITAEQSSAIAQTASNVKIGFNGIDNNIVIDSTGLAINDGDLTVKNGNNVVVIDGAHNMHKIMIEGTVAINVLQSDTDLSINIPHNFGYKPVIQCFQLGASGVDSYTSFPALTLGGSTGGIAMVMRSASTNTILNIGIVRLNASYPFAGTVYVKYFIYKEVAF